MAKANFSEKIRKDSELDYIKMCVESVCYCKIHTNTRKRSNVEARVIFSKILREMKTPLETIGSYLNKHHTTIIHLLNLANDLIETDEKFKEKYIVARNLANRGEQINYTEEETLSYREQISSLKCIIDELNLERKHTVKFNNKYDRIGSIIELIETNTPEGHEKLIEAQIINLFRRIAYKNQM
jgi:hypothetical protein